MLGCCRGLCFVTAIAKLTEGSGLKNLLNHINLSDKITFLKTLCPSVQLKHFVSRFFKINKHIKHINTEKMLLPIININRGKKEF